jgi:hypothetical protein
MYTLLCEMLKMARTLLEEKAATGSGTLVTNRNNGQNSNSIS